MNQKETFLFSLNTKGEYAPNWDSIPEDLGLKIVDDYFLKQANGIGFSGYSESADITDLDVFKNWQPPFMGIGHTLDNDTIAVYELTTQVMSTLGKFPFEAYSIAFEGYATDDLIFFHDLKEIGRITPHEARIDFLFTDVLQKQELLKIDTRIELNLYSSEDLIKAGV